MEDYTQYCSHIEAQKGYYQCNITTKTCVASNYPKDPEYLKLEKICDCPGKYLAAGEAGRVRDSLTDHSKRK